jgi:hypothetical protein
MFHHFLQAGKDRVFIAGAWDLLIQEQNQGVGGEVGRRLSDAVDDTQVSIPAEYFHKKARMSDQPLEQPMVIDGASLMRGHSIPNQSSGRPRLFLPAVAKESTLIRFSDGADRRKVGVLKTVVQSIGQRTKKSGPSAKSRELNRFKGRSETLVVSVDSV